MANIANILFGGLGGAVLTSAVTYYLSSRNKEKIKKTSEASELLEKININTNDTQGEYYLTKDSHSILDLVSDIYSNAVGEIIATAFHENPVVYGEGDAVRRFKAGDFTRITNEETCLTADEAKARSTLQKIKPGSLFVVIPKEESYTRLDGIFIRMRKESYLAMVTFRNPNDSNQNTCVLFQDGLAKHFFEYFKKLSIRYGL